MTWYNGYGLMAVYTGSELTSLTELACRNFWYGGRLTFPGKAGETYYFQVGRFWNDSGWADFYLEVTPPPVAGFWFDPGDPSIFDAVQFNNSSWDPAEVGIETMAWDFGDGATSSDWYPTHQYARTATTR